MTAEYVRAGEAAVLDRLADLTVRHGPWAAAVLLFGGPPVHVTPGRTLPVPAPLVPRTVAGQRALIAARSRRRRHRALLLIGRMWAQ